MKIFPLPPKENWICDRFVEEWKESFPLNYTDDPVSADLVWLIADWCWNHLPIDILTNKKVCATVHHIVPEKFGKKELNEFIYRDQFINAYHVPNKITKHFVSQLTKKRIKIIPYWLNKKVWKPLSKKEARKKLKISEKDYVIGSFQRDTEGHDLKSPKLEKGPDLFCNYIIKNRLKIEKKGKINVLLGAWRRQYVIKRLEEEGINYTFIEKASIETLKQMYAACDLYIVASRYEGGPQALLEAPAMKIPTISTNTGIAESVLSKNCIIDVKEEYYVPSKEDVEESFLKVSMLSIEDIGKEYLKLFKGVE